MTYPILNVLAPADTHDLVTLAEMKGVLRIPVDDVSKDAALQFMISTVSAAMAEMVDRGPGFGYQKVSETFHDVIPQKRLYLSRRPVVLADIESLTVNGVAILADLDWDLEEETGTLYKPSGGTWSGRVEAIYSGGYQLPVDAPKDLKGAAKAGVQESYVEYIRGATLTGVRSISHKGARVQYMQPGGSGGQGGGRASGLSATWSAIQSVLNHYIRPWV